MGHRTIEVHFALFSQNLRRSLNNRQEALAKQVEAVLTSPLTPVQESRVLSFVIRASLPDTLLHDNWFSVAIVLGRILRYVFFDITPPLCGFDPNMLECHEGAKACLC